MELEFLKPDLRKAVLSIIIFLAMPGPVYIPVLCETTLVSQPFAQCNQALSILPFALINTLEHSTSYWTNVLIPTYALILVASYVLACAIICFYDKRKKGVLVKGVLGAVIIVGLAFLITPTIGYSVEGPLFKNCPDGNTVLSGQDCPELPGQNDIIQDDFREKPPVVDEPFENILVNASNCFHGVAVTREKAEEFVSQCEFQYYELDVGHKPLDWWVVNDSIVLFEGEGYPEQPVNFPGSDPGEWEEGYKVDSFYIKINQSLNPAYKLEFGCGPPYCMWFRQGFEDVSVIQMGQVVY